MKKQTTLFTLMLVALIGLFASFPQVALAATAPTKMWVAPSDTNGIPAQIDVYQKNTQYQLFRS